ncbi:MAG: DUF2520 domain-containing protein [Bacteroidetes bacterium]|nr:DUF2520 domain-containing protein [Bacteroidota bacterium]
MKIVLIGAGNVATHFGKAMKRAGHSILQVYSRSDSSAATLAKKLSASPTTNVTEITGTADVYVVALRDEAIEPFLAAFGITGKIIVHTSGSVPINVFEKKFRNFGVIYPVQTFSKKHSVSFRNVPLCLEANNQHAKSKITSLSKSVSGEVHYLSSEKRKWIHLAAVFANNFTNHLFSVAESILAKENISLEMLHPLMHETALKARKNSPRDIQTGPAKRGDATVMEEHLKLLSSKKQFREIYRLMSESIEEMHGVRF